MAEKSWRSHASAKRWAAESSGPPPLMIAQAMNAAMASTATGTALVKSRRRRSAAGLIGLKPIQT